MKWNISSGLDVLEHMKRERRKPQRLLQNFSISQGLNSRSLAQGRLALEIQRAELAMNFFIKFSQGFQDAAAGDTASDSYHFVLRFPREKNQD